MSDIPWAAGEWTHPPVSAVEQGSDLLVTAVEGSDAWRITSYGVIHDSEHALVTGFPAESAMEVEFTADFAQQFDQAGLFVGVSPQRWVKAGVELAGGRPQVGAVVTDGRSDWSMAPVPGWIGRRIRVRVSRGGDALAIRVGAGSGELQLVRLLPFEPAEPAAAGPYVCAPTRSGLTIRFHAWRRSAPDESLH